MWDGTANRQRHAWAVMPVECRLIGPKYAVF
jgi:hypothetical protein